MDRKINDIFLQVEGDENSKVAAKMMFTDILPKIKNRKLIASHVFNNSKDELFNWRFKKKYVMETFEELYYKGCLYLKEFIIENKVFDLNIIQNLKIANEHKCKYYVVGYNALKEQTLHKEEQEKSVDFLIRNCKIPLVLIKDDKYRRGKGIKRFSWFVLFDRKHENCFKAFEAFLPLIDRKNDFIYAFTAIPQDGYHYEDTLKKPFYAKMKELGLEENSQFVYTCKDYTDSCAPDVEKEVNYNTKYYFDFVILYNDSYRYINGVDKSMFRMLTKLKSNICVFSVPYIENFEPSKMVDLEEPEKVRTLVESRVAEVEKEEEMRDRKEEEMNKGDMGEGEVVNE